ncbi:MAG TPA: metal-sulfur cluster assembly factor [Dehalococcoidia bacterium]
MVTVEDVREALMDVYDPELNYNVVDLGLVYDINVEDGNVHILMTLTTPLCPIGPMVEEQVREKLSLFPGVKDVQVEFTFDPPWNPSRMSEEAKFALGIG